VTRTIAPALSTRPLARAVRHAALCLSLGLVVCAAQAAEPAAQAMSIEIQTGSLDSALTQLSRATGLNIVFDRQLLASKSSPGLHGRYTPEAALNQLLGGSGLRAVQLGNGGYQVIDAPAVEPGALELGATTEGTNSYTTAQTSTATKMNLSIRETPQTVTVVTRQRMDDQHLASMTDVLKSTPGITMTQDGGERYNIYARGSAINTYQFDGVTTIQENETRSMPNTLLDMALYDHIEIVRGATGLMTGAGDPSGVVNLIRKKPTAEFKSYVQGSAGTWDDYRGEADVSGPLNAQKTLRGRLVAAKQDNGTYMDWYTQDREILYGVVEGDLTDSTLLRFGVDNQKYKATGSPGVPLLFTNGQPTDFSRSRSSGARGGYEKFDTTNYTATLEQALAHDWDLRVVANHMKIKRDVDNTTYDSQTSNTFIDQATGDASAGRADVGVKQVQRGLDINLKGPFELLGRTHDLAIGYNYADYHNDHQAFSGDIDSFDYYTWDNQIAEAPITGAMDFDIKIRQQGYFAASRFNFTDRWHLILGARVSDYHYDYYIHSYDLDGPFDYLRTDQRTETGVVTPYVGLVYDFTPEQSVYLSYTDIFKPQSAIDRNGTGLDPEVGRNYELGWKGEFFDGRLNANTAVYWVKRDNVAVADGTVGDTDVTAYRAESGAETKGIDLEVAGEILPGWNVQTGYSHTRTENAEGARITTQLPMDTFRFWTTYRLPGEWEKLTVGGGVNWNSSSSVLFPKVRNVQVATRVTQDDYAIASLMARYRFDEHVTATVNLENLFDETYYAGMAGSYGHYGAPRNANLTLRYDF